MIVYAQRFYLNGFFPCEIILPTRSSSAESGDEE